MQPFLFTAVAVSAVIFASSLNAQDPEPPPGETWFGKPGQLTGDRVRVGHLTPLPAVGGEFLVHVASPARSLPTLYRVGAGTVTWVQGPILGTDSVPGLWMDLAGDGEPRLIQPISPSQLLVWSGALGSGSIVRASSNSIPISPGARLASADLDGNGTPDLLMSSPWTGLPARTFLVRNRSGVAFDTHREQVLPFGGELSLGDVDDDGDVDLLVSGAADNGGSRLRLAVNRGDGTFVEGMPPLGDATVVNAGLVDIDGDGRMDLWALRRGAGIELDSIRLSFHQRGAEGYEERYSLVAPYVRDVDGRVVVPAWSDLNQDGRPEFLYPTLLDGVSRWTVFRGKGGFGFEVAEVLPIGGSVSVALVDHPRDGRPDVFFGLQTWAILPNLTPGTNALPTAPGNPRTEKVSPSSIRLVWDPATDANQTNALEYNIRIGTAPGLGDLVPSMSMADGCRLLRRPGNAGHRTERILEFGEMEVGAFYWSVQAIDAGGEAGPFTEPLRVDMNRNLAAPELIGPASVSTREDQAVAWVVGVSDAGSVPEAITVSATSGAGTVEVWPLNAAAPRERTLRFVPPPDWHGSADVTVTARDRAGLTSSRVVRIEVFPENDLPQLGGSSVPPIGFRGRVLRPVSLPFSDADLPLDTLSVEVASMTPEILPASLLRAKVVGGTNLILDSTGVAPAVGLARIRVTVRDAAGASAEQVLEIEVVEPAVAVGVRIPAEPGGTMLPADVDADGDLDLIHLLDGRLRLLKQEAGVWSTDTGPFASGVLEASVSDIDGDGRPDVWLRLDTHMIQPLLNRVTGWEAGAMTSVPAFERGQFADVDHDGVLDWIGFRGSADESARVFVLGSRNGPAEFAFEPGEIRVATGDFLRGGAALLAVRDGLGVSLVEANPSGTGWGKVAAPAAGSWPARQSGFPVGAIDLHGEGAGGFMVTVGSTFDLVGSLRDVMASTEAFPEPDGHVGVWNRSGGAPVLLIRAWSGLLEMFERVVPGRWSGTPLTSRPIAGRPTVVDLSGDGAPDLLVDELPVAGDESPRSWVLHAALGAVGGRPEAPTALAARATADRVELTWQPVPNPAVLTVAYAVRVGTQPGLADIMAPGSRVDGVRLFPTDMLEVATPKRVVSGLRPGQRIYWSVQAVSASGVGGPFASEGAFEVPASGWTLSVPDHLSLGADAAQLEVEVGKDLPDGMSFRCRTVPAIYLAPGEIEVRRIGTGYRLGVSMRPYWHGRFVLEIEAADSRGGLARAAATVTRGVYNPAVPHVRREIVYTEGNRPIPVPRAEVAQEAGLQRAEKLFGEAVGLDSLFRPPGGVALDGRYVWGARLIDRSGVPHAMEYVMLPALGSRVLRRASAGQLVLLVVDPPNTHGTLLQSDDLETWTAVQQYVTDVEGMFSVGVGSESGAGHRFLRAVPNRR